MPTQDASSLLQRIAHGLACALLAGSCASAPEAGASAGDSPQQAIARVIAIDDAAGAARNQGTLTQPAATVVRAYAAELRAIDLSQTPDDFQRAWTAHIAAWEALLPYLEQHAALRGEMHELFAGLLADSSPGAAGFKPLHDAVWETWADVEQAIAAQR